MKQFTLDEQTAISRAFDRGNYANAYESTNIDDFNLDEMSAHECAAFVLGFFGSYTLDEIGSARGIFDDAYWSDAGKHVIAAGYCGDRADDYKAEHDEYIAHGGT